jgi:hypothetical protein
MALKFAVNNSLSAITTLPSSISGGALNLISSQTASASATIDFTSGIDSTYDSYVFKFINCHPATDDVKFTFQLSTDSGSNYNVTMTTTTFNSIHAESGAESGLSYQSGLDQAQGTSFQNLTNRLGGDDDQSASGYLHLFNPSSTTFVKHFIATLNIGHYQDYSSNDFTAGYGNTTSAIDAIRFQMSSGNIDDGIIKMYGVS